MVRKEENWIFGQWIFDGEKEVWGSRGMSCLRGPGKGHRFGSLIAVMKSTWWNCLITEEAQRK